MVFTIAVGYKWIPLFVFSLILVISGYGIVSPKVISIFTFGLVLNAPNASFVSGSVRRELL